MLLRLRQIGRAPLDDVCGVVGVRLLLRLRQIGRTPLDDVCGVVGVRLLLPLAPFNLLVQFFNKLPLQLLFQLVLQLLTAQLFDLLHVLVPLLLILLLISFGHCRIISDNNDRRDGMGRLLLYGRRHR